MEEPKKHEGMVEIERLEAALRYTIAVIENYQLDIRDSKEIGGRFKKLPQFSTLGFCQGTFYAEALGTIEKIKNGEISCPFGLKRILEEMRHPSQPILVSMKAKSEVGEGELRGTKGEVKL